MTALSFALRVSLWDAALEAVRAVFRAGGLREVSTPIRSAEIALEPWIEPIAAGPERWLATSPELQMKRLLARGAGSIFQVAHVFRGGEVGSRHSEEFHLIEWYRVGGELPDVMRDVESLVEGVFAAVGRVFQDQPSLRGRHRPVAPVRWRRVELLGLMGETLGHQFVGNEPPEALKPVLDRVRTEAGTGLAPREGEVDPDDEAAQLDAWTELFSLWSDLYLDPYLASLAADEAVHVVDFPAPLAALAERDGPIGKRFESHVAAVELANGYRELRDGAEQRARFERVAALRRRHGLPPLPMPRAFLAELDRLPACSGAALGLDRLLALACGCEHLDLVALAL